MSGGGGGGGSVGDLVDVCFVVDCTGSMVTYINVCTSYIIYS